MTVLSICIPCYNRAAYLTETLESILSQWRDDLEISIADNASADGTAELIAWYQQKNTNIRYYRWESNQGADRNYLKAVELASGKYCWLLGSDDTLYPKAIQRIIKAIDEYEANIILFNRMLCTSKMEPTREDMYLDIGHLTEAVFDVGSPEGMKSYFEHARSLCCAFSYLSSMVFRKNLWDAIQTDETFIGTAYLHVQKLLGVCLGEGVLHYINRPLVNCRLGNDSFRDLGLARRVLIDLHGYNLLAERCLKAERPDCVGGFKSLVLLEYPFGRMLRYRGVLGGDPLWPEIQRTMKERYQYPVLRLLIANFLGRSRLLVRLSFFFRDYVARRSAPAKQKR